jgi:hypothetical protein
MAKKAKKGNGKAKMAVKAEQPKEATRTKSGVAKQGQASTPPGSGSRRPAQTRVRCQGEVRCSRG